MGFASVDAGFSQYRDAAEPPFSGMSGSERSSVIVSIWSMGEPPADVVGAARATRGCGPCTWLIARCLRG